ncbi:sulfurtransferase [Alteromonas mediterranea]|uniref:sulfurtransferase n=1 Tax=Alteromonas mediterranea TaxID=314275 RepID=UPI000903C779|nr:sulfurtransferase [Alteromonas mediterranea]APD94227.1 sulfurtransferase [Alteromonas mediterranea]APD97860.1 sulfurtransferase [Alteromonas mediterranea]
MSSVLLSVGELASSMQQKPITLLRALMDDPVSNTPDTRKAMVLPASVDFDLDSEGSDHTTGFPHSMPSADDLAIYLGNQGVTANTPIVVYDTRGIYTAPRVWWMLKALGHSDVYLLNGGQPAWKNAGLPVSEQQQYGKLTYQATPRPGWFSNSSAVLQALNTDAQLVDARSTARFKGEISEPRKGVRAGHMPGAFNVPFDTLLKNGHFLPVSELKNVFQGARIDLRKPIICTCGSGVTACIIGVAALMCGATQVSVYDGSWSEWGADTHYPVVTDE